MKKAFLSVSLQNRPHLTQVFEAITATLHQFDVMPIDFVTTYQFHTGQEREMMTLACSLIRNADVLIAEVSQKAIGVGIEVGYAAALGLPIIYLRQANAELSTTVGGIATYSLVYQATEDLANQLRLVLGVIFEKK